ncbi:MAG TPA: hypothetical protein VGL82_19460 [Bryobacteraceae bacterium]|jgi:hypothetical protein
MKAEVYSWRVSTDLKSGLEREARRRRLSLSAVLDMAAREWLKSTGTQNEGEEEQRQLHVAASKCLGIFAGDDARRSENVRRAMRQRLRAKHER